MRLKVAIAVALSVGTGSAQAADEAAGRALAERWCASCHVVSNAQTKGADAAPSFSAIAGRADFSAEQVAFFLLDPHPKMPNMTLSRAEARDLAAYIAAQKGR